MSESDLKRQVMARGGVAFVPVVFVTLGWFGLWLLWPAMPKEASAARPAGPEPASVVYLRASQSSMVFESPDLFVSGSKSQDRSGSIMEMMLEMPERAPAYLQEGAVRRIQGDRGETNGLGRAAREALKQYEFWRPEETVFAAGSATSAAGPVIEVSTALAARNFTMAEFPREMTNEVVSGSVVVHVTVGRDGTVENAFMESGCNNLRVHGMVLRAVERGRVEKAGDPCEGTVRVHFGGTGSK